MKLKKLTRAVAVLVPAVAVMAATAPADAATPDAYGSHCNGELCMQIESINGTKAEIRFYGNNCSVCNSFYGHFELQVPKGGPYNSPTKWYYKGGAFSTNYYFTETGGTGQWCGTAWSQSGTYYGKIGYTCVSA